MTENIKKPVALIILDGWGYREEKKDNAIAEANLPFFNSLWSDYPHSLLGASGEAVGLPDGQMGNSEVGHMTIGAGRPIDTDLVRISKAAKAGEFNTNPAFVQLFEHVKSQGSALHIIGLIGPGGVHSNSEHLFAFLDTAKTAGVQKIFIHCLTDGRDTPPESAAGYLKELEAKIAELGVGEIATVIGRYYAMDRDNNWDRVDKAYDAIFFGQGKLASGQPSEAVAKEYEIGLTDEHLVPLVFSNRAGQPHIITKNDGIFFFNFRADRARMLAKKILEQTENMNLCFVTMTKYEDSFKALVAFPQLEIKTTMAKEISQAGLTQAHIAETEKFAHATYFLNGGREESYQGEEDILIESHKDVRTHNEAPEMRAKEITDRVIEEIDKGTDFIFVNFANADMVGHTADVPAIIKGLEVVDSQLKRLVEKLTDKGGVAIITADHGNAEINIDPVTGAKHTAHTTDPVPFIVTDKSFTAQAGGLVDIAPTVLSLLDIRKPAEMTGKNLLVPLVN